MPSLAEVQAAFAKAMTIGDAAPIEAVLHSIAKPRERVAIHVRHYTASLTRALCDKFPASTWLVGAARLRDAASAFVRTHPPAEPCIAEYGAGFPQFLGACSRFSSVPYLASFAMLDWAVGQASIATEQAPRSWIDLSHVGPDRLMAATLALQPGLRYLRSGWRIDELMATYLSGREPERFELGATTTSIEVRGARGSVRLERLDPPTFAFRELLAQGRSIEDAAIAALDLDTAFDAGAALRSLAHAGLVTGVSAAATEAGK